MRVRIFIEGGGTASDGVFTEGWRKFFVAAGLLGQMPRVVRGEGREQTFDKFKTALQRRRPNELPILLVDSEEPVAPDHTVWQHLQSRHQHRFARPTDADDDSAFMMVQAMETWFIADQPALEGFFGTPFNRMTLQNLPALESIPKDDSLTMLRQATRRCRPRYRKSSVSYRLLAEIDPDLVAAACPHAKALLEYLRGL